MNKWKDSGKNFYKGKLFSEFIHYYVKGAKVGTIYRSPMFTQMWLNPNGNRWMFTVKGKYTGYSFRKRYQAKRFVEQYFNCMIK